MVREGRAKGAPLRRQLVAGIRRLITRGDLQAGDRLPTHQQLAHDASVHPRTVGQAYQELAEAGLIEQVQGRGTFVRASRRSRATVVVALPPWDEVISRPWISYSHHGFLSGIEAAFRELNVALRVVSLSRDSSLAEMSQWAERITQEHDGFLCLVRELEPLVRCLVEKRFPVVGYYQKYRVPELSHCDFDRYAATHQATAHLIRQGRRRIGMFGRTPQETYFGPGFSGYVEALAEHELPMDTRLLLRTDELHDTELWRRMIRQAVRERRLGDAIVTEVSRAGRVIVESLLEAGVRVPDDVAVVGFDEYAADAPSLKLPMTWMPIPRYEIGAEAAAMLVDLIDGKAEPPVRRKIVPKLIVGESCGAVAATSTDLEPRDLSSA